MVQTNRPRKDFKTFYVIEANMSGRYIEDELERAHECGYEMYSHGDKRIILILKQELSDAELAALNAWEWNRLKS